MLFISVEPDLCTDMKKTESMSGLRDSGSS